MYTSLKSDSRVAAQYVSYLLPIHAESRATNGRATNGSGGSRGGPPPILGKKKEEMTEGKMAGRARKSRPPPPPPPPPIAQGLDPPLNWHVQL